MDERSSAVSVLTVSPSECDLILVSNLISHSAWTHVCAKTAAEARERLRSGDIQVVLCESELPDGTWQTVLNDAAELATPPEVVVLSQHPDDRLWAAVLNLGAWDLLAKPIHARDFYRTVHHAFRHWADKIRQVHKKSVASELGNLRNAVGSSGSRSVVATTAVG